MAKAPASIPPSPLDLPPEPKFERLAKFLASAGVASRRECEEFISLGRVTVNGKMITELAFKVDPERDDVRCDDVRVKPEPKVYWWLNKPKGVLCTSKDTHGRRTVLDLLPRIGKRVYAVGRLDEESTGLLLMTNDGELALRLTHPRFGVSKTYLVLVAGKVTQDSLQKLQRGIWLAEGKAKAYSIKRLGTQGQATKLSIVLKEGQNREIRRMFAKLGHKVMDLHRVSIGPIKIRRLAIGNTRPATPEEIFMLRQLAKGVKVKPEADDRPARRPSSSKPSAPAIEEAGPSMPFRERKIPRGRKEFAADKIGKRNATLGKWQAKPAKKSSFGPPNERKRPAGKPRFGRKPKRGGR